MRHIRTLREGYGQQYCLVSVSIILSSIPVANVDAGLGNDIIQRAHSTAKRRIIYYLSTFIVFGFASKPAIIALIMLCYNGNLNDTIIPQQLCIPCFNVQLLILSLVPRPSHVCQCFMQKKNPGNVEKHGKAWVRGYITAAYALAPLHQCIDFLTDVFLALLAVIYEGIRLRQGPVISTSYQLHTGAGNRISHEFHLAIHMIQVMLKFYSVCILLYILHHYYDSNYEAPMAQVCSTELPPTEWFYVPCFIAYGLIVYIVRFI